MKTDIERFIVILVVTFSHTVSASPECSTGFQPYADRCVSQKMSDYIACVEANGGNKQDITNIVSSFIKKDVGGSINVEGSTRIFSGKLSPQAQKSSENEILAKIETHFFPGASSECSKVLALTAAPIDTYPIEARQTDLRIVRDYFHNQGRLVESTPVDTNAPDEMACKQLDKEIQIDLALSEDKLTVNKQQKYSDHCKTGFHAIRESEVVQSASLNDLDSIPIVYWGGRGRISTIQIKCYSGQCASYEDKFRWTNKDTPWTEDSLVGKNEYIDLEIRAPKGDPNGPEMAEIVLTLRALSRLISGGSDLAFCKKGGFDCNLGE